MKAADKQTTKRATIEPLKPRLSKEEMLEQLHGKRPKPLERQATRRLTKEEMELAAASLDPGSRATLDQCSVMVQRIALGAPCSLTPLRILRLAAGAEAEDSLSAADEAYTAIEEANEEAGEAAMATLRTVAAEADRLLLSLFCRQLFDRAIAHEVAHPSRVGAAAAPESARPNTAPTSAAAAVDWGMWANERRPGTASAGWFPRRWWTPPARVSPRKKTQPPPVSPSSTMDMPGGSISLPRMPSDESFGATTRPPPGATVEGDLHVADDIAASAVEQALMRASQ